MQSDINYLNGILKRGLRFGAKVPGDEKKFHVLEVRKSGASLIYSLGRIPPNKDPRFFNLMPKNKIIYNGNNCK